MDEATCKFCGQSVPVATWDTKPRLARHTERDSYYACEGSTELCEIAVDDYDGPTEIKPLFGKIKGRRGSNIGEKIAKAAEKSTKDLDPKLGNSRIPNWYEPKDFGW